MRVGGGGSRALQAHYIVVAVMFCSSPGDVTKRLAILRDVFALTYFQSRPFFVRLLDPTGGPRMVSTRLNLKRPWDVDHTASLKMYT